MMTARHLSPGSKPAVDYGLAMLHRHDISAVLYTSRHGELKCNYRILHALATEQALPLTNFALSVHNSAVGNLIIAVKEPIIPSSLSTSRDIFQQGLCGVTGLLQAGYQRALIVNFDGFLPEFYHPQLPLGMLTWPFTVALVIESNDNQQCGTRPHSTWDETMLLQSLLSLRYYLQSVEVSALPDERVQ